MVLTASWIRIVVGSTGFNGDPTAGADPRHHHDAGDRRDDHHDHDVHDPSSTVPGETTSSDRQHHVDLDDHHRAGHGPAADYRAYYYRAPADDRTAHHLATPPHDAAARGRRRPARPPAPQ